MSELERIRQSLPDLARDVKVNLQAVLDTSTLSSGTRWGVAVAAAAAARHPALREAIVREARAAAGDPVVEDALAAAVIMAMNNVYYRFRHVIEKPVYSEKPARLRMNRIAKPATNRVDFELFSLAASAINGCEACVRAHEHAVLEGGLTDDQVHDAIRIASVVHAAAVALEVSSELGSAANAA
jgi:alkyl hydroperoxide reductase subunit D